MSRQPATGFHEYGIHSSKLGNTTWIARSSRHARVEIINYEGWRNVGELTIRRIRSNVTDRPTETGEPKLPPWELEKQLQTLLTALTAGHPKALGRNQS